MPHTALARAIVVTDSPRVRPRPATVYELPARPVSRISGDAALRRFFGSAGWNARPLVRLLAVLGIGGLSWGTIFGLSALFVG
jgi:hypothetical protein